MSGESEAQRLSGVVRSALRLIGNDTPLSHDLWRAAAELQLLDKENEQLRASVQDAERYRWLRDFATSHGERAGSLNSPELWDSTIDAAIARDQDFFGEAPE